MNRWLIRAKTWLTEFHLRFSPQTNGIVPGWLAAAVTVWCMMDFAAFVLGAAFVGGDSFNGFTQNGSYFVCMHAHASCHEVSKAVFEYSRLHAISLFVSYPVAFLLSWLARRPRGK